MDEADYAQANEEFFREAALRSHFRSRHAPVDDAVASGLGAELQSAPNFLCRDCGQAIPARRLEVYPGAERCVGCQARMEARRS